jgi:hypothetical protein
MTGPYNEMSMLNPSTIGFALRLKERELRMRELSSLSALMHMSDPKSML